MQVSVETTSNLGRKLNISVPSEEIESKVEAKLQDLAKKVKMDGFRPGKVPLKVVKERYNDAVRQEVVGEVLQNTLFKALEQEKLNPAGMPNVDHINSKAGEPLEYSAIFEVYPEIELQDFSAIEVEKLSAQANDKDLEAVIEKIKKQHTEWEEVDKACAMGDKVVIDFEGTKEGEAFEGGSAQDVDLELGSNSFIPGFEEGLVGLKKDESKTLDLSFPESYHAKDLAGVKVQFAVNLKTVKTAKLPELNEELAKKLGVKDGNVETFKNQVKEHMHRELETTIKNKEKSELFDKLLEKHQFDVPEALIEREAESMFKNFFGGKNEEHIPKFADMPDAIKEQAKKRVSIGLLVAEIIKKNEIKADQEKVRAHIEDLAKSYDHPEQVISWYYSSKDNLASVEAVVLEEQVVAKILEDAKVTEKESSYDEIMNPKAETEQE